MDSTEAARCLPGNGAASRPYAELTSGYVGHTPIYAALVAEWRARGHTVPEHRDGQWASFAASTVSERASVPPVPFRVPIPLLRPPGGERPHGETGDERPDEEPGDAGPDQGPGDAPPDGRPPAGDAREELTSAPPPSAPR
ncbi:hypothetical protein [Streptomyces sp. Tu 3180]|uniref:hypothetical protein n=1 Tax=Streptomyces sp. Tu 3180 TaxID=2682611 RepID=UPI001FB72665|nr:hypothetical protein [Streptomyces sp. Tu 3180]